MATETAAAPAIPQVREPLRMTEQIIQEHQERMAKKRAERDKRLPELIACLDAEQAANVENQKRKFRFEVKCTVQQNDPKLKRAVPVDIVGQVDAQSESDAWAIFCDKFKIRTGPRHCNRQIRCLNGKQAA